MPKKFSELRASMSPASQAKANKASKIMLAEMPFNELIQALKLFQKNAGASLSTKEVVKQVSAFSRSNMIGC